MKAFALIALINAFLLTPLIVLLHATAAVEFKEHGKAISRGGYDGVFSFANFKQDKFSYLNITVLEKRLVDQMPECSFACLKTPPCFSFNLNAFPDIANKLHCELLPADKYNNTEEFIFSNFSHHFSITTPCSSWPCKNNGTCLPLYEDNDYKCACKRFTGRNCESDIDECASENECHTNATCTNTKGSYNCTCKGGFQGDGRDCNDTDECSSENDCHVNATCKNTKGSYNCICLEGFQGDGRNCTVVRLGDSVIIGGNQTYFDLVNNWLNPVAQSNGQWILCWRASLHGWAASTFHSLCNNKGPTVSLMRDTKYNVFGGYTSTSWSGSGTKNDLSAFLFSLKNPTDDPRKLPHRVGKSYSMRDYAGVGPSFGQGKDLFIANNADENSDSFENLGYTYTVPSGRLGDPFLTGAKHFTLNEVETFYETTP